MITAHKQQHTKFIAEIEKVEEELRTGSANVGRKTLDFLFVWLRAHILKSDKDGYAPLVRDMISNHKKI